MTTTKRSSLAAELEGALVSIRYCLASAGQERVASGELVRVANLGNVGFLVLGSSTGATKLVRIACVVSLDVTAWPEANAESRKAAAT
jgi:hypothetical protein